ncbi:hypothetical protein LTR37_005444 [Vermiconidia calcicola]|uniref:Uncharacterized protein n=1 Tax=Vermiconidia calcicola TaxID=1690605 RepID=A0ACC3NJQ4_9PEZI|nr:hypothetical protein LTR37_005444 [Vermiconidia calcicola]
MSSVGTIFDPASESSVRIEIGARHSFTVGSETSCLTSLDEWPSSLGKFARLSLDCDVRNRQWGRREDIVNLLNPVAMIYEKVKLSCCSGISSDIEEELRAHLHRPKLVCDIVQYWQDTEKHAKDALMLLDRAHVHEDRRSFLNHNIRDLGDRFLGKQQMSGQEETYINSVGQFRLYLESDGMKAACDTAREIEDPYSA